jgi:hypothetical protein
MAEQLRPSHSVAHHHVTVCGHDLECLEVADERRRREAAAVDVGTDGTADRQAIGAGLFLPDAPPRPHSARARQVRANDIRPLDAGFDLEQPSLLIEAAHAGEAPHVEERFAAEELLAAHRVPPAGYRQRSRLRGTSPHGAGHVFDRPWFEDARYRRPVQS